MTTKTEGAKAGHTKGPWSVNERGSVCVHNSHGYQEPIKLVGAWIEGAWEGDPEAIANAVLASAAPDLLEALIAIRDGAGIESVPDTDAQRLAYDAIAKALGQ